MRKGWIVVAVYFYSFIGDLVSFQVLFYVGYGPGVDTYVVRYDSSMFGEGLGVLLFLWVGKEERRGTLGKLVL